MKEEWVNQKKQLQKKAIIKEIAEGEKAELLGIKGSLKKESVNDGKFSGALSKDPGYTEYSSDKGKEEGEKISVDRRYYGAAARPGYAGTSKSRNGRKTENLAQKREAEKNSHVKSKEDVRTTDKKVIKQKKQTAGHMADTAKKTAGKKVSAAGSGAAHTVEKTGMTMEIAGAAAAYVETEAAEKINEGSPEGSVGNRLSSIGETAVLAAAVPDEFRRFVSGADSKMKSSQEKAKQCGIHIPTQKNKVQAKNNQGMAEKYVSRDGKSAAAGEKKVCTKKERKKQRKQNKSTEKKEKGKKKKIGIGIIQRMASFFTNDLSDTMFNFLKKSAPLLLIFDALICIGLVIFFLIEGIVSTISSVAAHPISFFLMTSEEETSGENYLRTVVQKKIMEFNTAIQTFQAEDTENNAVRYYAEEKKEAFEDDIISAYLARIYQKTGTDAQKLQEAGSEASYPYLYVDTKLEEDTLNEIFNLLNYTKTETKEIQELDYVEQIIVPVVDSPGTVIEKMPVAAHVCNFIDYRKAIQQGVALESDCLPCIAAQKSGISLGTILQEPKKGSRPGIKFQVVGFCDDLGENTISVCQTSQEAKEDKTYPCEKDMTIISGSRTYMQTVDLNHYKTVTKKTMTVYHHTLSDWMVGIEGNCPSDEEKEVLSEMESLLQ